MIIVFRKYSSWWNNFAALVGFPFWPITKNSVGLRGINSNPQKRLQTNSCSYLNTQKLHSSPGTFWTPSDCFSMNKSTKYPEVNLGSTPWKIRAPWKSLTSGSLQPRREIVLLALKTTFYHSVSTESLTWKTSPHWSANPSPGWKGDKSSDDIPHRKTQTPATLKWCRRIICLHLRPKRIQNLKDPIWMVINIPWS